MANVAIERVDEFTLRGGRWEFLVRRNRRTGLYSVACQRNRWGDGWKTIADGLSRDDALTQAAALAEEDERKNPELEIPF